ncbi:helix-turn-helix domain-containing protein [Roseomonas sp. CAU 1739]|uniref:TetR/AcrR family transcriptional regulator n=1 Tax=Roseomonas sp. CAU 1739 TaxID=3140364 RepID=UPI00325BA57A
MPRATQASSASGAAKKPGRPASLEQKKRLKLAAIREAARITFTEKGFDAATMQEIARRARVAIGTLFLYADNKRDIAFLASMEDFDRARAVGAAFPTTPPLAEQFTAIFAEYYRLHHASPAMAHIILSEFLFFNVGKHAREHAAGVRLMKAELARRAGLASARGALRATAAPADVAELAYIVFQGAVRAWVRAGADDLTAGLAACHRMLCLALDGVTASAETAVPVKRHRSAGIKPSAGAASTP